MQTTGAITYDSMLAMIAKGGPTPFRITYVIGQGKNKGQLREYVAYYGAPNPKDINPKTPRSGAEPKRYSLKAGGNLIFTEFSTRRLLTLFSYNIIHINGKKVI